MSKKEGTLWIILSGMLLLLGVLWLLFERSKRTSEADGFTADTDALRKDWQNVGQSVQKATEEYSRSTGA